MVIQPGDGLLQQMIFKDPALRPFKNQLSQTCARWQLRTQTIEFGRLPVIMGILNVTPDSFSDGGKFVDPSAAVDQALEMIAAGAGVIDVGGESTRPYSEPVSEREELRRTVEVVRRICEATTTPVSIDTSKSQVAIECLAAGAEIINDVTGLEGDRQMLEVALSSDAGLCAMHMQGTPQSMQDDPSYQNVVEEIFEYLQQRRDDLLEKGIQPAKICLDPGIGFGKTHQHNIELMANAERFHDLRCPILIGHSRKGVLARILGSKDADRAAATAGASAQLARSGIQVIRVHDVRVVQETIAAFDAVGGIDAQTASLT